MCKYSNKPIFGAIQYRCVGSNHLGPRMETKSRLRKMCVCVAQGWGPNLRVSRRWDHCGNHPHLLWRAGNLWGECEKHWLSSIKTSVTQMTRDNKVFSIQVTVTFTLKAMSHPPALSTPHRPSPDTEWGHWVVGPQSEIEFLSWLIGSLWLRSRSWRRGRMKRENSFMVNGGALVGGVEAGRSLFFSPSQSARCSSCVHYDALLGAEMVSA